VSGFVVREVSRTASSWRATGSLAEELARAGVVGIEGVDTRRLTLHLRDRGAMRCGVSTADLDADSLLERVRSHPAMEGSDLARSVSSDEPYAARDLVGSASAELGHVYRVAAYDFGVKYNIMRRLDAYGCDVHVFPASAPASELRKIEPDGIFLSNGPGDPAALPYAIRNVRELVDSDLPMFGICLGHQILGLAVGAKTYKLKFGHRGANHPVKELESGKVEITSQNHGFAVDPQSLPADYTLTHENLYDHTVEGFRHVTKPIFSVQYHPEASPGPHDADYLFRQFIESMEKR